MSELLGGKGANLAEMTNIGLPVPQGFTVTTEACTRYYEDGRQINDEIKGQIMEYISKMEEITGKQFGSKENPLLVSVRSGATWDSMKKWLMLSLPSPAIRAGHGTATAVSYRCFQMLLWALAKNTLKNS